MNRFVFILIAFAAAAIAHAQPVTVQPAYGIPYQTVGGQGAWTTADVKRHLELMESHDKRLANIEAAVGAKSNAAKKDMLTVAKASCASCHTPAKAEQRGGGFILFADETATALKPLSSREKSRIKESVVSGTMPPAGKLSPVDRSAFE